MWSAGVVLYELAKGSLPFPGSLPSGRTLASQDVLPLEERNGLRKNVFGQLCRYEVDYPISSQISTKNNVVLCCAVLCCVVFLCFFAQGELGTCRASLACPQQFVLKPVRSILTRSTEGMPFPCCSMHNATSQTAATLFVGSIDVLVLLFSDVTRKDSATWHSEGHEGPLLPAAAMLPSLCMAYNTVMLCTGMKLCVMCSWQHRFCGCSVHHCILPNSATRI